MLSKDKKKYNLKDNLDEQLTKWEETHKKYADEIERIFLNEETD